MAYNSQGALNGLFAPAYIKGNPESEAAVSAWNANRQAQLRPAPPPVTPPVTPGMPSGVPLGLQGWFGRLPPVTPPVTPGTPSGVPLGLQGWFDRLPPPLQQRLGPRIGMPPAGGSFTFTEPTAPPPPAGGAGPGGAGGSFTFTDPTLPSVQQPNATAIRNGITQALMQQGRPLGV